MKKIILLVLLLQIPLYFFVLRQPSENTNQELEKTIRDIEDSQKSSVRTVQMNIFNQIKPKSKSRSKAKQAVKVIAPRVKITTIFMGGNPVAQIKYQGSSSMVKIGQTFKDIQIIDIQKDGITIKYNDKEFFISQ